MELVDLYDENRIPLGKTAERYAKKKHGEYRVVVHVCVFDHLGRLLIQQRSKEKGAWGGYWDVSIGGGVDAGETSRQGAERRALRPWRSELCQRSPRCRPKAPAVFPSHAASPLPYRHDS